MSSKFLPGNIIALNNILMIILNEKPLNTDQYYVSIIQSLEDLPFLKFQELCPLDKDDVIFLFNDNDNDTDTLFIERPMDATLLDEDVVVVGRVKNSELMDFVNKKAAKHKARLKAQQEKFIESFTL
jgi:hypothetical protein